MFIDSKIALLDFIILGWNSIISNTHIVVALEFVTISQKHANLPNFWVHTDWEVMTWMLNHFKTYLKVIYKFRVH
jgi:hypothetical protein